MRKAIGIFLLILVWQTNSLFAQSAKDNRESKSNYIEIPGTRINLYPPEGYILASKFTGIKNAEIGASIMVAELAKPITKIRYGFTKDGFASQGMDLLETSEQIIDNQNGILYKATKKTGNTSFSKWILVLGDQSTSVMVSGTFPNGFDSETSDNILNCLLSLKYFPERNIAPEEGVAFSIDPKNTPLQLAHSYAGTLVYTLDGKFPTQHPEGVSFNLGSSLGKTSIENPRQFSIERYKSLPYTFDTAPELVKAQIDHLEGYELYGYGMDKSTGLKVLVYQLILFTHSAYYIAQGTAVGNFEKNLSLFIDIASTFRQTKR